MPNFSVCFQQILCNILMSKAACGQMHNIFVRWIYRFNSVLSHIQSSTCLGIILCARAWACVLSPAKATDNALCFIAYVSFVRFRFCNWNLSWRLIVREMDASVLVPDKCNRRFRWCCETVNYIRTASRASIQLFFPWNLGVNVIHLLSLKTQHRNATGAANVCICTIDSITRPTRSP